jgi:hypothetical protein
MYRKENKHKLHKQMKEYRIANKAKINAKVKCECGCEVMKRNLNEHQSTKKNI